MSQCIAGTTAPRALPPVLEVLSSTENLLDGVVASIQELERRLSVVIVPRDPEPCCPSPRGEAVSGTRDSLMVSTRVADIGGKASAAISMIESIMGRLQI